MRDNSENSRQISRILNKPSCIDGCVKKAFDFMSPDEFAGYVAENPLDSSRIFYYLSICNSERSHALMEGFSRHPYFSQEHCRCYGKPKKPILTLRSN